MWLDHGQKVTIRDNLWFHQYEQVGGNAIDFTCRFYNMDYPEAVQLMLSIGVGTMQEAVEPFPQKPLELPPKHENMRPVYGYLIRRRGIDKDVLDAFASGAFPPCKYSSNRLLLFLQFAALLSIERAGCLR